MLVEQILPLARERLVVLQINAPIREAAALMAKPHMDMIVVCRSGTMAGVVTKTDLVAEISRCPFGVALAARLDTIMTRDVVSCQPADALLDVWLTMKIRGLQRIPVLDASAKPIGVVYTQDALQGLLREVEIEDELLRDYVGGIGYR